LLRSCGLLPSIHGKSTMRSPSTPMSASYRRPRFNVRRGLIVQSSWIQPEYRLRWVKSSSLPTDWRYRMELGPSAIGFHVDASFHTGNIAASASAEGAASFVASRLPLHVLHHQ